MVAAKREAVRHPKDDEAEVAIVDTLRRHIISTTSEDLRHCRALDELAVVLSHRLIIRRELGELEEAFELHQQAIQFLAPEDSL